MKDVFLGRTPCSSTATRRARVVTGGGALLGLLAAAALPACSEESSPFGAGGGAGLAGSAGKASTGGSAGGGGTSSGATGKGGTAGAAGSASGATGGGSGGTAGTPSAGGSAGGNAGTGSGGTGNGGAAAGGGSGGQNNTGGTDGGSGTAGTRNDGSGGASGDGAGGSGGSTGGGLDAFGIRQLYPTVSGGTEWTSEHWDEDAYEISGRTDPNDPLGLSGMRGDGELQVTGDGELVMSGSQPRIYIYPPDSAPWRDVEVTVYYQRVEDEDTAYAGLVIGARSGEEGHTTSGACDAHTYYARVRNDGAFDFEKELEHPASATQSRVQPSTAWPPDGEVPRETWIGFKFVIYNIENGDVKLEAYRDMTNGENGGDWELVNETVDDGGWFVESTCSEHDPNDEGESDLVVVDGGTTFIRNTDVDEARYRWVSVREIEPG